MKLFLKQYTTKNPAFAAGFLVGRDYRIRTYDILLPKQALYQAELSPDAFAFPKLANFFYFASILFKKTCIYFQKIIIYTYY